MPLIDDVLKKSSKKFKPRPNKFPKMESESINSDQRVAESEFLHTIVPNREEDGITLINYRPWDDINTSNQSADNEEITIPGSLNVIENFNTPVPERIIRRKKSVILSNPEENIAPYKLDSPERINRSLYGVQRSIFLFLLGKIEMEDENYSYTIPVSIEEISIFAKCERSTIKTSVHRLKEKNIIQSYDRKSGRGGFVCFRIPMILKKEFDKSLKQYSLDI